MISSLKAFFTPGYAYDLHASTELSRACALLHVGEIIVNLRPRPFFSRSYTYDPYTTT